MTDNNTDRNINSGTENYAGPGQENAVFFDSDGGEGPAAGYGAQTGTGYPVDYTAPAGTGYPVDYTAPADTGYGADYAAPAGTGYPVDYTAPAGTGYPVDYTAPADTGYGADYAAPAGTADENDRQYLPAGLGTLPTITLQDTPEDNKRPSAVLDALPVITLQEALRQNNRPPAGSGQQTDRNVFTIQDIYSSMDNGGRRGAAKKRGSANRDPAIKLCAEVLLLFVIITACVTAPFSLNSITRTSTEQLRSESWMDEYNNGIYNLTSETLGDAYYMKKQYVIPENAISGSLPDKDCYHVNDDGSIDEAIKNALMYGLMQSKETVFTSDTDLWKNEPAEYYLDETIFTILWKEKINGFIVNFTEIFLSDASQFRRKLTGNQYGSSLRETTSQLSQSAKAVVGMSGDYYAWRTKGITVYQRKVCRCKTFAGMDVCYVKSNGDLLLKHYPQKDGVSEQDIQSLVDKNDVLFSLSFGPNLVVDGVPQKVNHRYELGEPSDRYSRASISQMGPLHYLLCTIDGGVNREEGTDIPNLQKILVRKGAYQAYTLDGGQTATIFYNGRIFNRVGYGSERNISDIIYFASAVGSAEAA